MLSNIGNIPQDNAAPPEAPQVDEGQLMSALRDLALESEIGGKAAELTSGFSPEAGVRDSVMGKVSRDQAIAFSAINRCVSLIAASISALPIEVRKRPKGQRPEPVMMDSPYYDILQRESGTDTSGARTFLDLTRTMVADMLTVGNAFAVIERDARGIPNGLTLLDTALVEIEFGTNKRRGSMRDDQRGRVNYQYRILDGGGDRDIFTPDQVLHFRMPSLHSRHTRNPFRAASEHGFARAELAGTSPLIALSQQLEVGVRGLDFVLAYFRSGGFQDYITSDKPIPDDTKKDILKYMAELAKIGMNRLPVVLGNGASIGRVESSAQGDDLSNLRNQNIAEIASAYGVPTFMLGLPQTSTWGTGIAELGSGFWRFSLQPIALSIAAELSAKLPRDRSVVFTFNHDQLTRASALEESTRVLSLIGGNNSPALLTPNEGRALLGHPPLPGGDELAKVAAYEPPAGTAPDGGGDDAPEN